MSTAAKYSGSRRRFAVACNVLSRRVRAEAESAAWKPAAPAEPHLHGNPASTTMLLMPGADITPDVIREETEAALAQAQLSIVYGERVLVCSDVPAGKAAEIMRAAARQNVPPVGHADIMPVARKESLRRFMEKRRERLSARAPYSAPSQEPSPSASTNGKDAESRCCLGLGIPGEYGR